MSSSCDQFSCDQDGLDISRELIHLDGLRFVRTEEFRGQVGVLVDLMKGFSRHVVTMLGLRTFIEARKAGESFELIDLFSVLVSLQSEAEAQRVVHDYMVEEFGVDHVYRSPCVVSEADGQIFGTAYGAVKGSFWAAVSGGLRAVKHARDVTLDWIWEMAAKAFRMALGGYYETLLKAASWISDVWTRMKKWCEEILVESATWMRGFQECLAFGVGLIGVAAVLVLIEKFMVGSHLVSNPLGLAQTFVLCYVSYIGLKNGGVALITTTTTEMISRLTGACQSVVASIARSMSADGSLGAAGQFAPLELLESFAASLSSVSADSIVKVGRTFNAVSQVKAGSLAIWGCVQTICEYLWMLLDRGFGIRSRALADLSVMLGHDVQGWLKRCEASCEHMLLFPSVPQDILKEFKTLRVQGQAIRAALMARSERGSVTALATVNKALEKLTQLVTSATLAGSAAPRFEPLWLAFVGKAGVGKSTVVNTLVARYLTSNGLDNADYYPRNTLDPFWSGYRRQTVVTYDDLGALSNGTSICEEAELIKLVSRDALPLNMASLEEKGLYFDSSLIVTSSNFMDHNPHAQIHDVLAYQRRRSLLVEIVAKEGVERVPEDPLAHQRYVLRNSIEPFDILREFESFDDFYAHFLNVNAEHDRVQRLIMSQMPMPEKSLSQSICAMTQLTTMLMPVIPLSIQSYVREHFPGWGLLACYGGHLYLWNAALDLQVIPVEKCSTKLDVGDVKRAQEDALVLAMRYNGILRSIPNIDPLAATFLADLVEKRAFGQDLAVRQALRVEDEQLFGVAEQMPRWQRAFVYVLSDSLMHSKRGFFSDLYEGMCFSLQKAYAMDVANWPTAVKLGLGLVAVFVCGGALLKALSYLGNFGTGAAFAVAATRTFSGGQNSDVEVRRKTAEYRHRNNPIQVRHWSYGQNFGIGYEWLMKHCLASVRYAHLDCQVLMLPGKRLVGVYHFLRRIPDNVIVEISLDEQSYYVCWHADCLQDIGGSELSVYTHPTLREVCATVNDRIVFGLEHLPDTFGAVLASCKRDDSGAYVSEVAGITVMKRTQPLTIYVGEYQRLVPMCLQYKASTVNKDCGSLIIANIGGVDKLVGIHVSATHGMGQACFLPAQLEVAAGQNWFEDDFKRFPFEEQLGNGTSVVGLLREEKKFFVQTKSSYVKTPDAWQLGTECAKEPAILSRFDDRLVGTVNAGYDPYRDGMEKYREEAGPFDPHILWKAAEDILETWHDAAADFDFSEASLSEAINGVPGVDYMEALVLNTSEGYPYVLSRDKCKGKARFLVSDDEGNLMPNAELARGIQRVEEEALAGAVTLVGIECAKDEKLPKKKIYEKPKTRLFTVLPMDYNIVVRMKFFAFVRFLMGKRHVLPCQVGTNPYGREWGRIACTLLEKGQNILCCDYSRFDGILPKPVMFTIAYMINSLMGGSPALKQQRESLLMACCGRYGICAGKVWRVENGIPSGFPLTVIINSVFNELIVRYLYRSCFVGDRLMGSLFSRYVALVTYGDDNLISVHSTICDKFSGEFVQKAAAAIGITITDGVDKSLPTLEFRTLERCDFLKRRFVKDSSGLWRCPMELESLWSQLHWVKTQHLGLHEAYLVNIEAVLRELYLHDVGLCQDFRARALALDWVMPAHLPSMESIAGFHEQQMGGVDTSGFAYDAIMTPSLLGPIGAIGKAAERDFEFRNLVASTCGSYKWIDGDFVVCLRFQSKYGDDGMYLDFPIVSGRGELPVAAWLRTHLVRKTSEIFKRLNGLLRAGRRIVFLGRNSNVVAVVFMVLFGLAADVLDVEHSNQVLARAMQVSSQLGYLLDAFPEAFFGKKRVETYVGKRHFRVLGLHAGEVSVMRRAVAGKCFEFVPGECPYFTDVKRMVDYAVRLLPSGVIAHTALEVPLLGGAPGWQWHEWLRSARVCTYDAVLRARCVLFDAQTAEVFDAHLEGTLVPGARLERCFHVDGKALGDLSGAELEVVHPLARLARQLAEFAG
ncbi:TPA_asm: polyprotein [Yucca gloriosa secovirus]|uniref:RNA1 polyprotein n=1 Tax=Yucca gloriosa secovirus TaxID=2936693 RepID=A0A9N7ABA4_9SECO|nr:TPA_asm: polyprotein [Yucca gloriosa secovirus]